jgi:nucleoside-diphosphate-sugar epimerase
MARVLVTGGSGFIGSTLTRALLRQNHEVVVLDNLSSPSPVALPESVTFIEGDVVNPPPIPGMFDTIYHFASLASPPRYLGDPIGTMRTGSEGTRAMLDRAAQDGAVFVYASTSEIYGDPEVHPQNEEYFGNVDIASPRACYDEAKRFGEALVHAYRRASVVPDVRIARIFNTYGPAMAPDDGRVITNLLVQALAGEPLTIHGDGQQTRSFCYVTDLVDGLLLLAESSVTEPVNLGNPTEITINELADLVCQLVGETGREFRELPQSDPMRRQPDIARARQQLGWSPTTDLREGLTRTLSYIVDLDLTAAGSGPRPREIRSA